MSSPRSAGRHVGPGDAVRGRRDAGLQRARSVTRTIAVGSVAAVAAFGLYLSRALPGHAATSSNSTVSASDGSTSNSTGPSDSQSPTDLSPPDSPPTQTHQQAPVVSGSS